MDILRDVHFWVGMAIPLLVLFWKLNPRCAGCRDLMHQVGHSQGVNKGLVAQLQSFTADKDQQIGYLTKLLDRTMIAAGVVKTEKSAAAIASEKEEKEELARLEKIRESGGEVFGDTSA